MIELDINGVCAFISLAATIIIAILQYKQGTRMEKLAQRQEAEERKHREQYIKQQRDKFIIKYKNDDDDIYYLPLCWISSVYDSSFSYHREMYREYNMLEEDVQNAICSYMNLKLSKPNKIGEDFYRQCVKAMQKKQDEYNHGNEHFSIFYDEAKYLHRCIKRYKKEDLPINLGELEDRFTDILLEHQNNKEEYSNPLELFADEYDFSGTHELMACEICAVVAKWIASWEDKSFTEKEQLFWIPGECGYEQIETMEDLFLLALLCVYVFLILPEGKVDTNE